MSKEKEIKSVAYWEGPFDPLPQVQRHKRTVKILRENGIDGVEIYKILKNSHGLILEIPVELTKEELKKQKTLAQVMRNAMQLMRSQFLTSEEFEVVESIYGRAYEESNIYEKDKDGKPVIKWEFGGTGKARTHLQVAKLQTKALFNYLDKFSRAHENGPRLFSKSKLFSLISELFFIVTEQTYSQAQIHDLYFRD